MSRTIVVGAAQMGPIARADSRAAVVGRMIALMDQAARRGCNLVVYPEVALTTFFPRWFMEDQAEVDAFFETEMPNEATAPLFRRARELGIAISFGYAEKTVVEGRVRRFNTAILTDRTGEIVHRYHKVHLSGHTENEPWRPFQHLEKRYFEPGDTLFAPADCLGGKIGLAICNDRRWPAIPDADARCRDLDDPTCISDSVTVSTFHGCPPGEPASAPTDAMPAPRPTIRRARRMCRSTLSTARPAASASTSAPTMPCSATRWRRRAPSRSASSPTSATAAATATLPVPKTAAPSPASPTCSARSTASRTRRTATACSSRGRRPAVASTSATAAGA